MIRVAFGRRHWLSYPIGFPNGEWSRYGEWSILGSDDPASAKWRPSAGSGCRPVAVQRETDDRASVRARQRSLWACSGGFDENRVKPTGAGQSRVSRCPGPTSGCQINVRRTSTATRLIRSSRLAKWGHRRPTATNRNAVQYMPLRRTAAAIWPGRQTRIIDTRQASERRRRFRVRFRRNDYRPHASS